MMTGHGGSRSAKEADRTKLLISNLPGDVDNEYIEMVLERQPYACDVVSVDIDHGAQCALVELESEEAICKVLKNGPITMMQTDVTVQRYHEDTRPTRAPRNTDKEAEQAKLIISNLPDGADEDFIENYLENKRRPYTVSVKSVEMDDTSKRATVQFDSVTDVDQVLANRPIVMMNTEVEIQKSPTNTRQIVHVSLDETDTGADADRSKIAISNLPDGADKDFIEVFFENERRPFAATVMSVEMDDVYKRAVVQFDSKHDETFVSKLCLDAFSAVDKVMNNTPIEMLKTEVTILRYDANAWKSKALAHSVVKQVNQIRSQNVPFEIDEGEDQYPSPGQHGEVVASGLSPSEHIEVRDQQPHHQHQPQLAQPQQEQQRQPQQQQQELQQPLQISHEQQHQPQPEKQQEHKQPQQQQSHDTTVSRALPDTKHNTIVVRGPPEVVMEDNMEVYFEDNRRSGGGEIEMISIHEGEKENVAYITFLSEEVAMAVAAREHECMKSPLNVALHNPIVTSTDEGDLLERDNDSESNDLVTGVPGESLTPQGTFSGEDDKSGNEDNASQTDKTRPSSDADEETRPVPQPRKLSDIENEAPDHVGDKMSPNPIGETGGTVSLDISSIQTGLKALKPAKITKKAMNPRDELLELIKKGPTLRSVKDAQNSDRPGMQKPREKDPRDELLAQIKKGTTLRSTKDSLVPDEPSDQRPKPSPRGGMMGSIKKGIHLKSAAAAAKAGKESENNTGKGNKGRGVQPPPEDHLSMLMKGLKAINVHTQDSDHSDDDGEFDD